MRLFGDPLIAHRPTRPDAVISCGSHDRETDRARRETVGPRSQTEPLTKVLDGSNRPRPARITYATWPIAAGELPRPSDPARALIDSGDHRPLRTPYGWA